MAKNLMEKVIKNSLYHTISKILSKAGGLIFTIILARFLMPETYGLYGLIFSIVTISIVISNFGVGETLTRYVSYSIGKGKKNKASAYIRYLFKTRFYLFSGIILLLLILNEVIANNLFQKPEIKTPLLFACLFIFMEIFSGFISSIFTALKDLKKVTIMEIVSQFSKIGLVILAFFLFPYVDKLQLVFVVLAVAVFLSSLTGFSLLDKKILYDKKLKKEKINKKKVLNYLGSVGFVTISMVLFVSVDTLMLGRMVSAEYLGFYRVASDLIIAISSMFGFGAVLLPVFTQIKGERFKRNFTRVFKTISTFTVPAILGTLVLGETILLTLYGKEYLTSALPLYILSPMIILMPLIGLYSIFFEAKERPEFLRKFIFVSLVINIILNFILIKYMPVLFNKGPEFAILGAGIATIISRGFYLTMLRKKFKKIQNIKTKKSFLLKPLFAGFVMAIVLILFNSLINNLWVLLFGSIVLGGAIYFIVMRWLGEKEEIELIKNILSLKSKSL